MHYIFNSYSHIYINYIPQISDESSFCYIGNTQSNNTTKKSIYLLALQDL